MLHAFGPDHVRLLSVDGEGKLTARSERYSANTQNKTDRVTTMAVLSPDERFLLVGTIFDERPSVSPDGTPKYVIANAQDPDGLVIFPVSGDGTLGAPSFHDGGGAVPFYIAFLHGRPDRFIIGTAIGDELVFGGGKTIRDGMGLVSRFKRSDGALDMVITNAVLIDPLLGIVKCDIGVLDGKVVGVARLEIRIPWISAPD